MKIALVDDEKNLRMAVSTALQKEGFDVIQYENGKQALEAGNSAPALYILDIMMPVMDGITLLRRLREKGDKTPVIFLTSKDDEFDKILRTRKFKEYYTARINVYEKEDEEKNSVRCYYAAVDLKFEEVVIMRDGVERSRFCTSLGPGYDAVSRLRMGIIRAFMKRL
jgi:CheY-like chemotaxis protein